MEQRIGESSAFMDTHVMFPDLLHARMVFKRRAQPVAYHAAPVIVGALVVTTIDVPVGKPKGLCLPQDGFQPPQ